MDNEGILGLIILLAVYVIFMALVGPLFTIWSLNTLFELGLAYSFKNWMAVIWLTLVVHGIKLNTKKD